MILIVILKSNKEHKTQPCPNFNSENGLLLLHWWSHEAVTTRLIKKKKKVFALCIPFAFDSNQSALVNVSESYQIRPHGKDKAYNQTFCV